MSLEDFENFRQMVFEDLSLQERLRAVVEREKFLQAVVEAGAERGYHFTVDEAAEEMRRSRRVWLEKWV